MWFRRSETCDQRCGYEQQQGVGQPGVIGQEVEDGCDANPDRLVVAGDWTTKPDERYRKWGTITKEAGWKGVTDTILTNTDKTNGRPQANLFNYLKQNGLWTQTATGIDPAKNPEKLNPFCPIRNVTKDFPPTLFLHGTADPEVPHTQSVEMKAALDKIDVPTEIILIKEGGHGLWGGDRKLIEKAFQRSMEYIREALTQP